MSFSSDRSLSVQTMRKDCGGLKRALVFPALLLLQGGVASATELSFSAVPVTSRILTCESPGGYVLPQTDTCLRIGAAVRVDDVAGFTATSFAIGQNPGRLSAHATSFGRSGIRTLAILSADVRTQTELGPLRVYVSIRGRRGAAASDLAEPAPLGR